MEHDMGRGPGDLLWGGLKIVQSPICTPVPRVQLSHTYTAGTPEGVASMNAWLLKMFGSKDVAFRSGDTCYVSQRAYSQLMTLRRVEPITRGQIFYYGGA